MILKIKKGDNLTVFFINLFLYVQYTDMELYKLYMSVERINRDEDEKCYIVGGGLVVVSSSLLLVFCYQRSEHSVIQSYSVR